MDIGGIEEVPAEANPDLRSCEDLRQDRCRGRRDDRISRSDSPPTHGPTSLVLELCGDYRYLTVHGDQSGFRRERFGSRDWPPIHLCGDTSHRRIRRPGRGRERNSRPSPRRCASTRHAHLRGCAERIGSRNGPGRPTASRSPGPGPPWPKRGPALR